MDKVELAGRRARARGTWRAGSMIAVLAIAVASGCASDGRSAAPGVTGTADATAPIGTTGAGGARVGGAPSSRGMAALLDVLPPATGPKHAVGLQDIEGARRAWNLPALPANASWKEWVDRSNALFVTSVGLVVDRSLMTCNSCSNDAGTPDYATYVAGARAEHGFWLDDIDAIASDEAATVILGHFDPTVTAKADEASNPGAVSSTDGDATVLDIPCPSDGRPVDPLLELRCVSAGSAHYYHAHLADRLITSTSADGVHAAIERASGRGASAADDRALVSIAEGLDGEHVYFAHVIDSWRAGCDAADDTGSTRACVNERLFDDGTRGAYGYARDDTHVDGILVFALKSRDAASASRAGATVKHWYDDGKSLINNQPFNTTYDPAYVRVDGDLTVVDVPFKSGRAGVREFQRELATRDFPAW